MTVSRYLVATAAILLSVSPALAQGRGGGMGGGMGGGIGTGVSGGMGGTPPIWDAPPRYTASFVPFGFPEQYVCHQDMAGFIATLATSQPADRESASFQMIPGLSDSKCFSFRAANKLGMFFRHSNSRIYLHATDETPLFYADATFCQERGFADEQAITFRSFNYPQRVIHLRNVNELWIDGGGHLVLTDGQGNRTGIVGGELLEEIPGVTYSFAESGEIA